MEADLYNIVFPTRNDPSAIRGELNSINPSYMALVGMDASLPSDIPYFQICI